MSDQTITIAKPGLSVRLAKRLGAEEGVATAEYACCTAVGCGFAGLLWGILQSDSISKLVVKTIVKAFSLFHF